MFIIWIIRRWATAGPKQRGPGRQSPAPPAGVHAPGPSFAPFFAAVGAALTFLGLVFGGWLLVLGILALILTLLYWLREGVTEYEHIEPTTTLLPAVVHEGPPEGVHMPGPSFRPILVAASVSVIFLGLVVGGWVLIAGIVVTILALIGWLGDARREYRYTLEADKTGHLRERPRSPLPGRRGRHLGAHRRGRRRHQRRPHPADRGRGRRRVARAERRVGRAVVRATLGAGRAVGPGRATW